MRAKEFAPLAPTAASDARYPTSKCGTRPDCVSDAALDLLADYRARGYEVWLELGLQSAHDATLARINRGHGFAAYVDAVTRARRHAVPVYAHLIVGLPQEWPAVNAICAILERDGAQGSNPQGGTCSAAP